MRVLHITNNYPTTNYPIFGIFVKEQIDSLTKLGVENDVFFMNTREYGKWEYLKALIRLRKHLSNNNYDIIHCHHSYSAVIYLCTLKIFKKKNVLSYQNDPEREGGKLLFLILYQTFDLIILKNKSPEIKYSKTTFLPNGVNIDFFAPIDKVSSKQKLNLHENKRYIVFMDSYNRRTQKRIDRFMETIRILKSKYSLMDIEPLVLTNTERSLIPAYLCSSELHLLTSDFEGSPNSVKECLACNVPVVSTPVGSVAELIADIDGCYISETFNPEELAKLVITSLNDKKFSSRDQLTRKELDINTVAKKLFNLYNSQLLKGKDS